MEKKGEREEGREGGRVGMWETWRQKGWRRKAEEANGDGGGGKVMIATCTGILLDPVGKGLV